MEKITADFPLHRVSRARPARNVWRSRRQKLTRVIGSWLRSSNLRRVNDPLVARIVSGNSPNAEWDPEQKAQLVQSITKLLQQQPDVVKEVARSASAGQGLTIRGIFVDAKVLQLALEANAKLQQSNAPAYAVAPVFSPRVGSAGAPTINTYAGSPWSAGALDSDKHSSGGDFVLFWDLLQSLAFREDAEAP